MSFENLPQVSEKAPRWMNENDYGQPLTLESFEQKEDKQVELVFSTSLLERVRITERTDKPNYAYIRNNATSGNKVFVFRKDAKGFRQPVVV